VGGTAPRGKLKASRQPSHVSIPLPREPDRPDAPEQLPPAEPTDLQRKLAGLSAPSRLTGWARPFADLESCWNACSSPEHLLWLAARLSTTAQDRCAVISCLAELTRRAARGNRKTNASVEQAVSLAETWARTGASPDDLLAAERAALDTAAWAAFVAAEESARSRTMFRAAPRGRPASFATSRALGALAEWREADRTRRLALAAACAARAAAYAAQADAGWVASVGESAGYAAGGRGDRAARKSARLIRRRLPCPRLG
jgi:hypothetical protein